jgi:hypothetical protein
MDGEAVERTAYDKRWRDEHADRAGAQPMLPSQLISIPKMFQANIAVATLIASTRSGCARERMSTSIVSGNFISRGLPLKVDNRWGLQLFESGRT